MDPTLDAAIVCAALEVIPAAPRDLSDLLSSVASVPDILQVQAHDSHRSASLRRYLAQEVEAERINEWQRRIRALQSKYHDFDFVTLADSRYPRAVSQAYDRPPILFFRGKLPVGVATAVVGSRRASPEVLEFASAVSRTLVSANQVVVSGLARGVDSIAHEECLLAGGTTLAVLGHAVDADIYPPENAALAARIVRRGAIVSQFKLGAPPTSSSFIQRNSVISAFAAVSVVLTADEKSGSRTELDSALAQGRRVVIPALLARTNSWLRSLAASDSRIDIVDSPVDVLAVVDRTQPGLQDQEGVEN